MRVSGTLALTPSLSPSRGRRMPLVSVSLSPAQLLPRRRVARESRKLVERPAVLCGKRRNKRRNRIGFVPPFYGFSRLFTANGKKHSHGGPDELTTGYAAPDGASEVGSGRDYYKDSAPNGAADTHAMTRP
jgi:hypothetical protein